MNLNYYSIFYVQKRQEYKQSVQRALSKWLPEEKIFELDTVNDCLNVLRRAGTQKQKTIFYRDIRSHLLADDIVFESNEVCVFRIIIHIT